MFALWIPSSRNASSNLLIAVCCLRHPRSIWLSKLPLVHQKEPSLLVETVSCKRTKLDPTNVHYLAYYKENLPKIKLTRPRLENDEERGLEEQCQQEEEEPQEDDWILNNSVQIQIFTTFTHNLCWEIEYKFENKQIFIHFPIIFHYLLHLHTVMNY